MSHVIETTERLIEPILEKKKLELVDVEYVKEGPNWFLRVYINKEGGVDISECGEVSEELSKKLDEADPIKDAYFLEVSSPGVERPLKTKKDFERDRKSTRLNSSHVSISYAYSLSLHDALPILCKRRTELVFTCLY